MYELADNDFLIAHGLSIDEFEGILSYVSGQIGPIRNQLVLQ